MAGGINKTAGKTTGAPAKVIGKSANVSTRSGVMSGLEKASKKHKELEDNYEKLKANLAEVDVAGANPEDVQRATVDLDTARTKLAAYAGTLNAGVGTVAEPPKPITNSVEIPEPMVDIKNEPTEETNPGGLFVPQNTQPGANMANPNDTRRSESANPGTPDSERWSPAEEDEYHIQNGGYSPAAAREAAGIETDGEIVAWSELRNSNSTPVIVAYGPRNSRKYKRSTAYREASILDKTKAKQFGLRKRYGDAKDDNGNLICKPEEFKAILGVAFNCPVEELKPKPPRKKGDPPRERSPRVEIWVRWEVNGKIETTWEVRSSIKHLFRSFCDQYIYESALHFEAQHNLYLQGQRTAEDRSPTPFPQAAPVIKDEGQAVNLTAPAIQITKPVNAAASTDLSPIKQYRAEWCDLKDIDPKKMTPEDDANFKMAWNYYLKQNAQ
ncbi:hypothetical protein V491_00656 [Pseudogymnoascus sp. VKM F-3775]|nr:hypothetical protein V491_00656 [Pseudogymnoascus sp. VKM F-3775]